eukprot:4361868-Pyramimonas_sp.AAC.1
MDSRGYFSTDSLEMYSSGLPGIPLESYGSSVDFNAHTNGPQGPLWISQGIRIGVPTDSHEPKWTPIVTPME